MRRLGRNQSPVFKAKVALSADFYVAALQEAIDRYELPDIVNTDQGSRFASA
jgi:hypothetical protein